MRTVEEVTKRITKQIAPILGEVLQGPEANVAQKRIRDNIAVVIQEMRDERVAALQNQHNRMSSRAIQQWEDDQARMAEVVAAQKRSDEQQCRELREADAVSYKLSLDDAVARTRAFEREAADKRVNDTAAAAETKRLQDVAAARADEQQKCVTLRAADATAAETKRVNDIAAARADEQSKCTVLRAADATAAETKRVADVAAARRDERAKCVREIEVAPVTGITIALTLFANSMRQQIRDYVAGGPR